MEPRSGSGRGLIPISKEFREGDLAGQGRRQGDVRKKEITGMAAPAKTKNSLTLGNLEATILRQGDSDTRSLWGGRHHAGVSGAPVAELQAVLAGVGVLGGKPDGQFGIHTTQALRRFKWYLDNMGNRLKVSAGARPAGGAIQPFTVRVAGSDGTCNAAMANELLLWRRDGFVTTTPIVRVSLTKLSNVDRGDGFQLLDYPAASDGEVLVHSDFAEIISVKLNEQAKKSKVTVLLNQTFRREDVPPSGAVVTPAKKSQHLVGHAVDLNIKDGDTINTAHMFKVGTETDAADSFVDGLKALPGMRWGGDFAEVDYVHFDDYLDPAGDDYAMTHYFAQASFHANHPMRLIS